MARKAADAAIGATKAALIEMGRKHGRKRTLPATEQAGQEILSLPFHQHLTEQHIEHVVSALGQFLKSAGGAMCSTAARC